MILFVKCLREQLKKEPGLPEYVVNSRDGVEVGRLQNGILTSKCGNRSPQNSGVDCLTDVL